MAYQLRIYAEAVRHNGKPYYEEVGRAIFGTPDMARRMFDAMTEHFKKYGYENDGEVIKYLLKLSHSGDKADSASQVISFAWNKALGSWQFVKAVSVWNGVNPREISKEEWSELIRDGRLSLLVGVDASPELKNERQREYAEKVRARDLENKKILAELSDEQARNNPEQKKTINGKTRERIAYEKALELEKKRQKRETEKERKRREEEEWIEEERRQLEEERKKREQKELRDQLFREQEEKKKERARRKELGKKHIEEYHRRLEEKEKKEREEKEQHDGRDQEDTGGDE